MENIHDAEKENIVSLTKNNIFNNKSKRTTLGVLSHASLAEGLQGEPNNMINFNINTEQNKFATTKIINENIDVFVQQKKDKFAVKSVSSLPINIIDIYTDENNENSCGPNKKKEANVFDVCEIRKQTEAPKNTETPLTVNDTISPMSIDKSLIESIEPAQSILDDSFNRTIRNERERFFEIPEYQNDIILYLREAEQRNRPKPGYMNKQPDINNAMRTVLVDWLVEVCEEYRLQSETLCLAVSYIDRFLSVMSVVRAKLQLVGTAAMFIAAKYEEIYPPDVSEFVYITDDTYTRSQVLRMEQLILKVLSFDLCVPTPVVFTVAYSIINEIPEQIKYLTLYLCELSLMEADPFLYVLPSKLSAAALALARYVLKMPLWNKDLQDSTGYTLEELRPVISCLNKTHLNAMDLKEQAIQEKYKLHKHMQVANLQPIKLINESFECMEDDGNIDKENIEHGDHMALNKAITA